LASGSAVGQLNGRWAIAFKIFLITWPMFLAIWGWTILGVINNSTDIAVIKSNIFTLKDGMKNRMLIGQLSSTVSNLADKVEMLHAH